MKTFLLTLTIASQLAFASTKNEVVVKFKSAAEAEEFMSYMSGQGEQDMGNWMSHNLPELDRLPQYDFEKFLIDYTK